MTTILAIGDTHGDTSAICNLAIPQARKNDCEYIVQCGDFGYWEHHDKGRVFLDKVSKHLVRNGITMYWLDGNHENHPLLWEKYGNDGLVEIRPNLFYMSRGYAWKFDDVQCLAVGGAFSIDRDWRITEELVEGRPGTLWWPTEMLTDTDVSTAINSAIANDPIDVMFTHDCPTGIDVPGIHAVDKWQFPETWENRDRLREIFDVARPRLLVHGHYHTPYVGGMYWQIRDGEELQGCRVEGLNYGGRTGFAIVLDLGVLFGSH